MEINTLVINKRTLNSGYILFQDSKSAKEWRDSLEQLHIGYNSFVWIVNYKTYYGFKMFRFKKQFIELCRTLKEVLG